MKALVLDGHGGMDSLSLQTAFPDPVAGPGDVVVAVRATSLNHHDVFTRRGMPGIRITMPAIMGIDVAGEVLTVGADVTGWAPDDRVLIDPINRVDGGLVGGNGPAQMPVAFVVPSPGKRLTGGDIKNFAIANGPAYAHPRRIALVTELPWAGTNKLDRAALIAQARALEATGAWSS